MPGELDATLTVHDERFFLRALTGSDIGLGESFMDGDWTTPDLVPLVRLMLRNRRVLDGQSRLTGALRRLAGGIARRLRDNSLAGQPPAHPSALRPRQRVLPPLPRRRSAHVLVRLLRISRRFARAGAGPEGRSHLPGAELSPDRPRARDWQRVGRLRRLGGDPLRLPRDDHDDQRRTVPPRLRVAVAHRRGRGAHRRAARGLPGTDRAVRQGRQHRDVRGGRSQPLRRLLHGASTACSRRTA